MHKLIILYFIVLCSACKKEGSPYNGFIDADLTYLSSNFAGRLANLYVKRGQFVKKNQLLFKLEQTSENYALEMSLFKQNNLLAQRKAIIAQLQYDEINYQRTLRLREQAVASQNELDITKKELEVLQNQLAAIDDQIKSSRADLATKYWDIDRKKSYAPDAGIIFDTYFTNDEYIQGGQPVISLITQARIKVVFFVPEIELSKIILNTKVKISSDHTPDLASGTINYIAKIAQYTPPIIYSREERQNLVFRIEAGIDEPDLAKIHLGQPISVEFVN